MDTFAVAALADPQVLADKMQLGVDAIAGRHIDMTSIKILMDAIARFDPIFLAINLIVICLIIILTYISARIVDRLLLNYIPKVAVKGKMKMDETVQVVIRRLASATIYIIGLMLVIFQIPQLNKLATAMLASAGIVGLAIGFAAQDSLSNFISGIFMAIFQPFRVGDMVDFRGDYGEIEDLTLRHTVIRTWDKRRIIIPNSVINKEAIINWTIKELDIIWTVDFEIARVSDIDRAREIALNEAKSHPAVLKDKEIKVLLTSSKGSDQNLKLYFHANDRDMAFTAGCDIRESVRKKFEKEGIALSI